MLIYIDHNVRAEFLVISFQIDHFIKLSLFFYKNQEGQTPWKETQTLKSHNLFICDCSTIQDPTIKIQTAENNPQGSINDGVHRWLRNQLLDQHIHV